jgi:hypothetical protein
MILYYTDVDFAFAISIEFDLLDVFVIKTALKLRFF